MSGLPPFSLSHVGMYVHDMERMLEFYTKVMGFVVTDRGRAGEAAIVSASQAERDHHQRGLHHLPADRQLGRAARPRRHARPPDQRAGELARVDAGGHGRAAGQSRSSSLIEVLARVPATTRFAMTAQ